MVDVDNLSGLNGKRPFAPFWVRLVSGETLHVMEPFTAIVTRTRFYFTPDRRLMRHIPIEEVEAHGPLEASGDSARGGR